MTQRRPRDWADTIMNITLADGGLFTPLDLLFDLPPAATKTVARLIGSLTILNDDVSEQVNGVTRVDMGIGVASLEAFTAGVVPDPSASQDYPTRGWLWVETAVVIQNNVTASRGFWQYPWVKFDVGASRKVDKGVLYFTMNNNAAAGTSLTVRIVGRIRAVCLL